MQFPFCRQLQKTAANGKLAAEEIENILKTAGKVENSAEKRKTGRQGRENAHQAAQQKSPTDLKWLDISIKRTWKIGHRLR